MTADEQGASGAYSTVEWAHEFVNPQEDDDLMRCRDPEICQVRRVNRHPIRHVMRRVTYGPWVPVTPPAQLPGDDSRHPSASTPQEDPR